MDRLSGLSFDQVFEAAASTAPSPGGGAVMGLVGMMGVALLLKAVRISLKRRPDDEALAAAEGEFDRLARRLAADADADAASFDAYMAAGRLPRESAERVQRLDAAALDSIEVAIVALGHAAEGITLGKSLAERLSPRMAPDLAGGLALLEAVRANAVDNARDSLDRTEDSPRRAALSERLGQLIAATADAVERV